MAEKIQLIEDLKKLSLSFRKGLISAENFSLEWDNLCQKCSSN